MKTINSIFKTFLVALFLAAQVHFSYAQTAALLPVAPQQFFDKNGNPVSSGSVGYYIPGTTTLKQVWQDDAQTTPWSNPITLNAGGWPPNNKGIYGNGIYRQIIKDKNNNIISDQPTSATGSGGGSGTSVGDGNSVGTILAWSGMIAPNQYQFAYGQSLSRATYPELYQAITLATDVVCVGGNATLTSITDTSNIPVGAALEGNCIVAGSTVISKTINTVTLSIAANISTTTNVRFFPYGNGNGTTTFNAPDLRGKVIPGRNNMGGVVSSNLTSTYYGSSPDAVGANGGTQSSTLAQSNLPNVNFNVSIPSGQGSHNHSYTIANISSAALQPGGASIPYPISASANTGSTTLPALTGTAASGGSGTAFSLVQPSITLNYIIKVTPDTSVSGLFGVASIGGMQGIIACGSGLTCAGNIISAAASSAGGSDTQVQFNSSSNLAGSPAFIWVSPKLSIGLNGSITGQLGLAGSTSGNLTQTVGSIAGTPIITWGNTSGTPAVTASSPLAINTTTGNLTITGAALTKTDDTNVTLTLGGSSSTALVNAASLTLGWTGTLAAGRLNSNVVQSIVNDTNINGSISAQALTFSWAGTLSVVRGGTGAATFTTNEPIIGNGTSPLTQGTRSGNTTKFVTTTGVLTPGDCVSIDANGNFVDAGVVCGGGGGSGSPGGSNTTVQYNNSGSFGGISGATSDGTTLTLVNPVLGTPASATLTNATGLPIATGISGLGTGISTALAVNTGSVGAPSIIIAKGTITLGTSTITSGTCASIVTVPATGVATTDVINAGLNGRLSTVTGYLPATTGALRIDIYPTTNNVNAEVCNPNSISITPSAVTLNFNVVR